ncbi:hypothetical protein IQ255_19490 [Pleurocapsales cyanobacterium LEGE 10410]|nr:hypothetical protein [Pleurocapsales cyanobacterium LEGE 10410]
MLELDELEILTLLLDVTEELNCHFEESHDYDSKMTTGFHVYDFHMERQTIVKEEVKRQIKLQEKLAHSLDDDKAKQAFLEDVEINKECLKLATNGKKHTKLIDDF